MSRAYTFNYETGLPVEDNPFGAASAQNNNPQEGDTGSFFGNGGLGATLGALAGTGLGAVLGPAGAAIGAGLGKMGGSLIDSAISGATHGKKPAARPARRPLKKNEQKILAEGEEKTRK